MSSVYDQGDDAFRSALNDYSSQYGSIAQARLGTDIGLESSRESLYSAGAQIKESAGLQKVSDRIQAEGEKYMNEMGIDMSTSGVLTGAGLVLKGTGEAMQFFSSKSGLGLNNTTAAARAANPRYRALNVDREEPFSAPLRERMNNAQDISDARRLNAPEERQAELEDDPIGDLREGGGGVSRATNLDDIIRGGGAESTRMGGGRGRTTTDLDAAEDPALGDINDPLGAFAESGGAPALTEREPVTDINDPDFGAARGVARSTQLDPADVQVRPRRSAPIEDEQTGLRGEPEEPDVSDVNEASFGERAGALDEGGLGDVASRLRQGTSSQLDLFEDTDTLRPRAMTLDDLRLPDRPTGVTAGEGSLRTTAELDVSTDVTGGDFARIRSATVGRAPPEVPRSVERMGEGEDTLPTASEQQTGDLPEPIRPAAAESFNVRNPPPPPQRASTPEPEAEETDTTDYFRAEGQQDPTGQFAGRGAPPEGDAGPRGPPRPGADGAGEAETQATTEAREVAAQGQSEVASAESNVTSEISQESQAATRTAATVTEDIAPEIETATETAVASGWSTAGSALLTGGGALLKLAGIAALPLAGFALFESIKGVQDAIADEDVDPYAKIRGQVATANAHLNQMGQTISSDQFASQIAGSTPKFGSLAAPTFNTSALTSGGQTGHF